MIKTAKSKITIIDNYVDKTTLDLLTKKANNFEVIIIGKNNLHLSELDIKKFNSEHPKLELFHSYKYHDWFLIIDNDVIYHLAASLKDLAKKCFAISVLEDKSLLDKIH